MLSAFGLPVGGDLTEARAFFASRNLASHIKDVFRLAGISEVAMTNDPLDPEEAPAWESDPAAERPLRTSSRTSATLSPGTGAARFGE